MQSLGQWVRRLDEPVADNASTRNWMLARPIGPATAADGALCVRSPLGWSLQFERLPPAGWVAQLLTEGSAQ